MPLTSAQAIRELITDTPRYHDATYFGDGTAQRFTLPHKNLTTASAYVPIGAGGTAWSATGCTFSNSGWVDFSGVISAQSAWRANFVYTVFSDDVVDEYLSAEGSINGAALRFARTLLFDASKRAYWMSPDGASFDDTRSIGALKDLISALKHEEEEEAIQGGGFNSWAETQGDY